MQWNQELNTVQLMTSLVYGGPGLIKGLMMGIANYEKKKRKHRERYLNLQLGAERPQKISPLKQPKTTQNPQTETIIVL